jgi:hypothetical protein
MELEVERFPLSSQDLFLFSFVHLYLGLSSSHLQCFLVILHEFILPQVLPVLTFSI